MERRYVIIAALIGLLVLFGYSVYLDYDSLMVKLNELIFGGVFSHETYSVGFATDDFIQVVGVHEDGFIVFNAGNESIDEVFLIVDDKLVSFGLNTPLPPLRGTLLEYDYVSSLSVRALTVFDEDFNATFQEYNDYFIELNNECDDNNVCTKDDFVNNSCTHTFMENKQKYGCSGSFGCLSDGKYGSICSCINGTCTDTCGNNACEYWENSTTCLNDCNNCEESISECAGVWFYGGVNISNGEYCACCGDDSLSDVFNNGTHYCSNGLVFTELDSAHHACESAGYDWFYTPVISFANKTIMSNDYIQAFSINTADIDNDGDKDLVTSSYAGKINWWENNAGMWNKINVDLSSPSPAEVLPFDIDKDGDVDILTVSESQDSIILYKNLNIIGTSWDKIIVYSPLDGASSVAVGDLDEDGDLDIVSAGHSANKIFWFEQTGSAWNQHVLDALFAGARSVKTADLDNDGVVDVIAAGEINDQVAWWGYNGTDWIKQLISDNFNGVRSIEIADVDGDKDLDVIGSAYYNNSINWFENLDGFGTSWSNHLIRGDFFTASMISVNDLDSDGDVDVVGVSQRDNIIMYWLNTGGNSWNEYLLTDSFNGVFDVFADDLDSDGDVDVFASSYTNNTLAWWRNLALSGVNGPCCGDDGLLDDFNSTSNSCINGN